MLTHRYGARCQLSEELYDDLSTRVLPHVVRECGKSRMIKIWVPECSGGELVYACAYFLHAWHTPMGFRIFGTDSETANVVRARSGKSIEELRRTLPEKLARDFFRKSTEGLHVRNDVRDACIFSEHHLSIDPPFSRLDLIVWPKIPDLRFKSEILPLLHFALRDTGMLWCCDFQQSEEAHIHFEPLSISPYLFRRKPPVLPRRYVFPHGRRQPPEVKPGERELQAALEDLTAAQEELQTSNEELGTVNRQLEERNRQLFASNTQLSSVVESLGIPLIMLDAELRIRAFNQNARHVFNIRREDVGRNIADLRPHFPLPDLAELARAVVEQDAPYEGEVLDSQDRWHLLRIRPYKNAENAVAGVMIAIVDVHELRTAREREQAARAEAEAANAAKDQFLSTLSHELRTPLTPILAWTQMLRSRNLDRDARNKALDTIERAVKTQRRLIDDLLDVSRIVAGKFHMQKQPLFLAEVLRSAIETVRPAADAKGLTIEQDISTDAPVLGDATRLQQVFWNILINAVRFSRPQESIEVRLRHFDDTLEVSIVDHGEGIDPEDMTKIFERFRQVDSSTTRRHSGLGLGLSIARSIVEMHGGQIRAVSAGKNQGTTVTVSLPASSEAPAPASAERHTDRLGNVRILVVDDDSDTLDSIGFVLREAGARVEMAHSAAEAMDLLRAHTPDVIICDLGMPGEDGYSLIRRIRREPPLDLVPAIALTAYAGEDSRRAALEAGFHAHLPKPVDFAKVTAAISNLLTTV